MIRRYPCKRKQQWYGSSRRWAANDKVMHETVVLLQTTVRFCIDDFNTVLLWQGFDE